MSLRYEGGKRKGGGVAAGRRRGRGRGRKGREKGVIRKGGKEEEKE